MSNQSNPFRDMPEELKRAVQQVLRKMQNQDDDVLVMLAILGAIAQEWERKKPL